MFFSEIFLTWAGTVFSGSRESRAGPCSAPSSPTSPEGEQQLTRHSNRGSKCNFPLLKFKKRIFLMFLLFSFFIIVLCYF